MMRDFKTTMPASPLETYRKHLNAMRAWLRGRNYHDALRALDFAMQYHDGVRKDGVTPEMHHQISICNYLRTLEPHLIWPEACFTTAILHDVREDYDVTDKKIADLFSADIAKMVERLTKTYRGTKKNTDVYFEEIADCPVASIDKLADRIHNLQTMVGVFTPEKQISYVAEAEEHFIPMMKLARHRFPKQEPAYENAKLMLYNQMSLVRAMHAPKEDTNAVPAYGTPVPIPLGPSSPMTRRP